MADTFEQIQAKVAEAIKEEFPDDAPEVSEKPAKEAAKPAREPAQETASDADDGDAAPELTPAQKARAEAEAKAREKGWVPKDEWIEAGHDEDDWKPAKQFLARGDEIEERKSSRKRQDSLEKQVAELSRMLKAKLEAETRKEVAAKAAVRDDAIRAGDVQRVHQIEQELAQVQKPIEVTPAELVQFVQDNKEWWDVDPLATETAVKYYGALEAKDRDAVSENLAKTKKYLARRFPDLFPADRADAAEAAQAIVQQQQTRKLSTVSLPSSGNAGIKRGKQWSDLPSEAKRVAEQITRAGVMTKEQYVKEFFGEA